MPRVLRPLLLALLVLLSAPSGRAQHTLTLPDRVSGELTSSTKHVPLTAADDLRPADRYTLSLGAGQIATVRMESTAFDTYLKVFLNGDFHSRNDDYEGSRAVSQLTLSQSGTYEILAGAFSGTTNTGDYTLAVSGSGSGSTLPSPGAFDLRLPGTTQGRLTSSTEHVELTAAGNHRPADRYTFSLAPGQRATVRMESSSFDTYLKVLLDGAFHQRNDDYQGSHAVSMLELSQPGTYTLLAGAFSATDNTGPYTLTTTLSGEITDAPPPRQSPSGGDGGSIQAVLTDDALTLPILASGANRKADSYSVQLYAGEVLVVTMESTAFDTYLAISHRSEILARNDDAGSTQRSQIRFVVPTDGEYYIYAGTFTESGRGGYTFTWYVE